MLFTPSHTLLLPRVKASSRVFGMSPPPRRCGWVSKVNSTPAVSIAGDAARIGLFEGLWPGRRAAKGEHAGEGRKLAEFLWVQVFARIEIDDHPARTLGHFIRPDAVPISGARRALNIDWPRADALVNGEIVGAVPGHAKGDRRRPIAPQDDVAGNELEPVRDCLGVSD